MEAFARPDGQVEAYTEVLDAARFPPAKYDDIFVSYLKARYAGRQLGAVIVIGETGFNFILKHPDLFPGVPVVFSTIEQRTLKGRELPPNMTGAPITYNIKGTIDLARQLQPNVRDIVVIAGTSPYDKIWSGELLKGIKELAPGLSSRCLDNLSLDEVLAEVAKLPPDTIVLLASFLRDAKGQSFTTSYVARKVTAVSTAPVYSFAAHFLPEGIVGGTLQDFSEEGTATAALTLRVLSGEKPLPPIDYAPHTPLVINWKALRKWHLPPDRLPPDAKILYREPTLWEQHSGLIIGIAAIVVIQSVLLTILLLQRARRLRAEASLIRSEERISLAAESTGMGLWVCDLVRDDIWSTKTFRRFFALDEIRPLTLEGFFSRLHPEDREPVRQAIRKAIDSRADYQVECRTAGSHPNQGETWFAGRGRAVYDGSGKPLRLLGVCTDITAQRRIELEVQGHRRELAHLSRVALLGEMASSLAHELNQPLTAIITNAGAGRRFLDHADIDRSELTTLFQDIADDGERAGNVIRGIRRMVRKADETRQPVDLNDSVAKILRLLRSDAITRHCSLGSELAPDLPAVEADAVQIEQVLLNLAMNGLEAMDKVPPGQRRLIIRTELQDGAVAVSVRDHGSGLPVENRDRIFQQFFSTKTEGMGMGLAIARTIVETHGGTLVAENAPGGGAVSRFTLPVLQIAATST